MHAFISDSALPFASSQAPTWDSFSGKAHSSVVEPALGMQKVPASIPQHVWLKGFQAARGMTDIYPRTV